MRGRQESPRCQYIFPDAKRCNAPLSGRGRYKWCKRCESLVRRKKQRSGSAEWQQAWRARHPDLHRTRTWIHRRVKKVERRLIKNYPYLDPKLVHRTLQRAFCDTFQETDFLSMQFAAVGILPNGFYTRVRTNFDPGWQPAWNRVWVIDLIEWPVPFLANGKEYCFLASIEAQKGLFETLCNILGDILENGGAAKGRATVLYMPHVRKAGIKFLFDISKDLPGWKADSSVISSAKQCRDKFLNSGYYWVSSFNPTRADLANLLPADIWQNEGFLLRAFIELVDQVGHEHNAQELRVALSQGAKVLKDNGVK